MSKEINNEALPYTLSLCWVQVMGIKGRRVHMIEELSETIISFQRGNVVNGA